MLMKCLRADIGVAGNRRISRVVEVRMLLPIADVLAQRDDYFSMVRASFLQNDRVSILRFAADDYDLVIEILPRALVNVLGNGELQFFRRSEIEIIGKPEKGWILAPHEGHFVVRHDGVTVQRFPDRRHAEWWLEEQQVLQHARAS